MGLGGGIGLQRVKEDVGCHDVLGREWIREGGLRKLFGISGRGLWWGGVGWWDWLAEGERGRWLCMIILYVTQKSEKKRWV